VVLDLLDQIIRSTLAYSADPSWRDRRRLALIESLADGREQRESYLPAGLLDRHMMTRPVKIEAHY